MPLVTTKDGNHWNANFEGAGRTLLFIHGWSADSRIWLSQRNHFSKKFRAVTVDLPGHGQTPWQDLTLEQIAKDFLEIVENDEGQGGVNIVGSSFGGLVALQMLALDPENISAQVFVGAQPKFSQSADYPWGLAPERIAKLKKQLIADFPAIVPIFFRSLFTPQERASERFKWLQSFRQNEAVPCQEALLRLLDVLMGADLREVLRTSNLPIQFINGTEDTICPKELYAQLKGEMPQAQFDWIDGCGHFPFVSHPNEFNQVLEKFLGSRDD